MSSTLKMEAICSSETSVDTQRTTRRYIPEVYTLYLSTRSADPNVEHLNVQNDNVSNSFVWV
jgi:hypothetical protein